MLGELLLFPQEAGLSVLPVLRPEDFYSDPHRAAARALLQAIEDGRPHDAATFGAFLRSRPRGLELVDPSQFLQTMMEMAPSCGDYLRHAEIIRECSLKRGIIQAAARFMEEGLNGKRAVEVLSDHRVSVEDLEREAAGCGLETFSASSLPTMDIAPLVPLIGNNLLTVGGFLAIVGKQGLGKTFAAFDLAIRLASGGGGPWLGHSLRPEPTPVLWLFGEGGRARVKQRAMDLAAGAPLPERLHFHVPKDYPLDLCLRTDVARVRVAIETLKSRYSSDTVLLIVDPLANWAVYDQNTEADRLLRGLLSLQRSLNATLCVVHHPKKPQIGVAKGDSNSARGDSRLAGAVQSMLMFDEEEGGKVRLTWAKHNDSPAEEPVIARLDGATRRFQILRKLSESQSAGTLIWAALEEARVLGDGWVFKKQLAVAASSSLRTVERHLAALVKSGQVECDSDAGGTTARYRLPEGP